MLVLKYSKKDALVHFYVKEKNHRMRALYLVAIIIIAIFVSHFRLSVNGSVQPADTSRFFPKKSRIPSTMLISFATFSIKMRTHTVDIT